LGICLPRAAVDFMTDDLQFEWRTEKIHVEGATVQYRLSSVAALSSIDQLEVLWMGLVPFVLRRNDKDCI
jgi:hypothetical protein